MKEHEAGLVMGAARFHAETGRLARWDVIGQEITQYEDPTTGLIRKELQQPRHCPGCDQKDALTLFVKGGFPHVRCQGCQLVYVAPILCDDLLDSEYGHSRYADSWIDVLLSEHQVAFDRPKFQHGIDLLGRFTNVGRVLDIGCATGHFLEVAKASGWDIQGVELTDRAVDLCRQKGIPVLQKKLAEDLFPRGHFQAVTFWDVLEHIPDPRCMLGMLHSLMADDGALLILVPNVASLAARVLRERCNMFAGYAHINLFSPETLTGLLERTGFVVRHLETIISEIGVLNNFLDYQDPYRGSAPPSDRLLGWLTEKEIHDRQMGYKILAVAQKAK